MHLKYINIKYIVAFIIICLLSSCVLTNNFGNNNSKNPVNDNTELDNDVTVNLSNDNGYVGNNAKDTTLSPQFLFIFSKNIDISTLEKGLTLSSIDNPNKTIDLSYLNSGSLDTILVKPKLELTATSAYKLTLDGTKIRTIEGKHINSGAFYFSTGDDNKLIVSLQYPIGILKDSLKAVDLKLYFSHALNKTEKIDKSAVLVYTYTARTPDIDIDKIYVDEESPHVLHVLLQTTLQTSTLYKISINTNPNKGYVIKDELKHITFNPNALSFSTRSDSQVFCQLESTSNLKRFMPEIILKCKNLNDGIVSEDKINHVTDNLKLFYRDSRNIKLFKSIYKTAQAAEIVDKVDVIYKLSSDDILEDVNYYIEIPSNKVSEDKQIPYTMLPFVATPIQSINSSKIEGFHNYAVNMKEYKDDEKTDSSKLFVFGNGKLVKSSYKGNFQSIFIDRYDTDIEKDKSPNLYKKSFAYTLPTGFVDPNAYINMIDAALDKEDIYMLVKTNLKPSLDTITYSDNYTILQSSFSSQTLFKAEKFYYDELKDEDVYFIDDINKQNPMKVAAVVGTNIITSNNSGKTLVYVLNNATTKDYTGCMIVSYIADSAHSLSEFNYSRFFAVYNSDTKVFCDKIFSYEDKDGNRRIGVFYHTDNYWQQRGLEILDETLQEKIFESQFYHMTSKWGDISPISTFVPSTNKAYIVSAANTKLMVFSCDLSVATKGGPNVCSEDYTLGAKDGSSGQYNHGLLGLTPIKDMEYIENYQSYDNYILNNTKHATYIDTNKGNFVNYIHTSKNYDITLWNAPSPKPSQYNETNYNLVRI
jgi:hypothetical protein